MPVLRAAKRAGCLAFDSHSRVNLGVLLRWMHGPDAQDGTQNVDWHQRYKRSMALGAEQALAKARGDLVDAHELGAALMAAGTACKALINQVVAEAPVTLAGAGGDVVEIRTILRGVLDEHFTKFRDAVKPYLCAVDAHTTAAEAAILNPSETNEKTESKNQSETDQEEANDAAA